MGLASRIYSGYGIGMFDFNNDGWKDLFTANAHVNDRVELYEATKYKLHNSVFLNRGDVMIRDVRHIHRGTPNRSNKSRPVLVLGVDSPTANNADHHGLQVTHRFLESMPDQVRNHLTYRAVDELEPIHQKHQIETLMMGDA